MALIVHMVDDGFGNIWECERGYTTAHYEQCEMQVVRPGKVQCDKCDRLRALELAAQYGDLREG